MTAMDRLIYTIGHSTRTIEEFVDILRGVDVRCVVDVRTIPRSRTNPGYNLDILPETLAGWQIRHRYISELGGRRGRQKNVPPELNGFWDNQSFHNYADYALSGDFRAGLDELAGMARETPCAIMCSEAVWWRCHRRIIADYLLADGWTVFHLMSRGRTESARLTPAASLSLGSILYPRGLIGAQGH